MNYDSDVLDEQPIVDLYEIVGKESFISLLCTFTDDCNERVCAIGKFASDQDADNVRIQAHTLATSALSFGGRKMEVLCRKIESNAGAGTIIEDDIAALSDAAKQTVLALEEYRKSIGA